MVHSGPVVSTVLDVPQTKSHKIMNLMKCNFILFFKMDSSPVPDLFLVILKRFIIIFKVYVLPWEINLTTSSNITKIRGFIFYLNF